MKDTIDQKKLWAIVEDTRQPRDKVSLWYDKLVINKETSMCAEKQCQRVKLKGYVEHQTK